MQKRYCPKCHKLVMTQRPEMNIALAIFLFLCTGSTLFWVYLIIYFLQDEDRCVFCNTRTDHYRGQPLRNQQYGGNFNNQYNQNMNTNNVNNSNFYRTRGVNNIPGPIRNQNSSSSASYTAASPPNNVSRAPSYNNNVQSVRPNSNGMIIDENTGEMINNSTIKKFCPMCGTPLKSGVKFCPSCGSEVSNI